MKLSRLLLSLALAVVGLSWALAQDAASDAKSKADTRTITGCLTKGDSADKFLLDAKDGSSWEVRSSNVNLTDHVGHTVSVIGVVENPVLHNLKEDAKEAAKDAHLKKEHKEYGRLKVTNVQMVSDSCTK